MKKIIFIVATREKESLFFSNTMTGRSLKYFNFPFVEVDIYGENTKGLSEVYNKSIEKHLQDEAILVFAHDDIYILDFFWAKTLYQGLSNYDVVGVIGNKNRLKNQPSWAFKDTNGTWDEIENLSGVIGHGTQFPADSLGVFGPNSEVEILDGVFISISTEILRSKKIRFDETFKFHFYDMDFCRSSKNANLRLGTIPLSLIHASTGNYSKNDWLDSYKKYIFKWGD